MSKKKARKKPTSFVTLIPAGTSFATAIPPSGLPITQDILDAIRDTIAHGVAVKATEGKDVSDDEFEAGKAYAAMMIDLRYDWLAANGLLACVNLTDAQEKQWKQWLAWMLS